MRRYMKADKLFQKACWIWPGTVHDALRNVYADFRYDFSLTARPSPAHFYITADQCYMFYVNGQYVGRGPARGYQFSWPYDEYDLTPFLRSGHNWISIRVYNAGCGTFQYIHQWAYGMLCAGRIGALEIVSDERWLTRFSPAYRRDTAKLSVQLNYQEWMDARVDDQSWVRSSRRPSGWNSSPVRRPFGHMPWHALEPRGIPNLGNEIIMYRKIIARAAGKNDKSYKENSNLTVPWFGELEKQTWKSVEEPGEQLTIPAAGKGGLRAAVLDLGRPSVGNLIVDAVGAGGEPVDFFFCEVVSPNGRPILAEPTAGCAMAMTARLILRKGRTLHEFYQMMGHRYLTVIARDTLKPLRLRLKLRETIYPLQMKGNFKCGDEVLNGIYNICVRTQQVCALDSYVDTPWREQGQWWGDARVQAQNTFHISGDSRLLLRGIRSIARQEVPNGLTYGHAPTVAHNCILPDFSIIWALTIWDYYYQTGDIRPFVEQWKRIERLLGYFRGEGKSKNGLLRYDPRYWLFLDWCKIHRSGNPALLNLWYLMMLEKLAEMARVAGMRVQQAAFIREYRQQKILVLKYFWDKRAGLFHDGLTPEGRPVKMHSIHTQTLALLCGLQSDKAASLIAKRLLPYLRGKQIPGALPSSYWVSYVYEFMKRSGYGAEVARHIRAQWAPMIPSGGTWEVFKIRFGMSSVTHAWAAHPLYHLTGTLGGVMQNDVAWKEIIFMPVIIPEYGPVNTVVPTPHGNIKSGWRVQGGKARVTLELPRGVRGEVRLPDLCKNVAGKNQWKIKTG